MVEEASNSASGTHIEHVQLYDRDLGTIKNIDLAGSVGNEQSFMFFI